MKIEVSVYIDTELRLSIAKTQELFADSLKVLLTNPDIKSAFIGGIGVYGYEATP